MTAAAPTEVPVFQESIGGALIDAARINVMAALHVLPPPEALGARTRIVLPGDEQGELPPANAHECLAQAMQWLDAARAVEMERAAAHGAPPTSLHVIAGGATNGR